MNKQIINLAILGGVGYAVYHFLIKKKSITTETTTDAVQSSTDSTPKTPTSKTTNNQNSAYAKKVETLQGLLKVAIDGKVGKQTLGALENLYTSPPASIIPEVSFKNNYPNLRNKGVGILSPNNIDHYINAIKQGTTPNAIYYKTSGSFVDDMRTWGSGQNTNVKLPWQ